MSGKRSLWRSGSAARSKTVSTSGSDDGTSYSAVSHVAQLLRPNRWLVVLLVVVSVPAALCESAVLVVVAEVAGALVDHGTRLSLSAGPVHATASINQMLLLGALLAVGRIGFQVPVAYLPARILADTQLAMRDSLGSAYLHAPWPVKASEPEGKLQELLTSQVIQATFAVQTTLTMLSTGVTLAVLVASALMVGLIPAVVVIVAGVALFALLRPLAHLGSRRAQALSGSQLEYADVVSESGRLAEEAQVFGVGDRLHARLLELAGVIRGRYLLTIFLGVLAPGIYYGLVLLLLVGGLGLLEATAAGRVVSLGASVLLLVRAANYGQMVQGQYQSWKQQAPFLARLGETDRTYRSAVTTAGPASISEPPALALDRVSYTYGRGQPALQDVSFQVEPGEAIGIVGPTGAGKSTLVQILLGLREPTAGTYLIAGVDSSSYSRKEYSACFAYVPQEPKLFRATVADNIAFYRDVDPATIRRSAELAAIDADIVSWPDGYGTVIGQRANAVSGGQRQRLTLARALAGNPSVLILDEPTSSLDAGSEAFVTESLASLKGRLTIFVVAHRLSTLEFCDRILVLDEGKVEAFAPAEELRRHDGSYQRAMAIAPFVPQETGPA